MQETTETFEANGNLANSKEPNSAENSSDESIHSKDADTCCLRRQSNNSRESEQGRSEDKPSFSSIVDRRDRKGVIPLFFERASGNLLNPCFDSETLESEFQRFSVNVDKSRFQIAVIYIAFVCITLAIYFGIERNESDHKLQIKLSVGTACAGFISLLLFAVTKFVKLYSRPIEARTLSIIVSLLYATAMVVSFFVLSPNDLNYGARFGLASCFIVVIYTMMPALPLYGSLIVALGFSIAYEISANITVDPVRDAAEIAGAILLHVCTHFLAISIVFMAQIRRRSTFWRVGQSVVAKQDLDIEQRVKNRMIKSVMPKKVADFLIKDHIKPQGTRQRSVAFRPFAMYKMENVSILFADIVGFTKMSAKKEADHLVQLLNMLFGKFDELTEINKCEKISTLGDCYYCVAGCPEQSEYHAISCVEMGLDIIKEIKNFCQETKEDVDMRVGIHTGNVLCGIVGDKRRRFDVWSNDVNLANKMESAGKPGRVHITETTLSFLNNLYTVEDGEGIARTNKEAESLKSYFIMERKDILLCKPWKKDGDTLKSSLNSLQDSPLKNENSKNNTKISDTEDVRLDIVKSSKFVVADDTIEKTFLAKRALSPTMSPTKGNLQKQLVKTPLPFPATFNFTYGITLNEALRRDAMRASNDNQLVKLMHEKKIQKEYFFNPPLSIWNLNFMDVRENREEEEETNDIEMTPYANSNNRDEKQQQSTESKYRDEGFKGFKLNPKVITFASPKVHFMFDVATCAVTLFITVIAGFLLFHNNLEEHSALITVIVICLLGMICLLVYQFMKFSPSRFPKKITKCAAPPEKEISENGSTEEGPNSIAFQDAQNHNRSPVGNESCDTFKKKLLSPWITAHLVGGVIMCLPIIVVFAFYQDCEFTKSWGTAKAEYFTMLTMIALFHFCSFTQLSYLMKNLIACGWCLAFVLVLLVPPTDCIKIDANRSKSFLPDIVAVAILQVVLVSVLNRIHEKGVRANFYGDKEAAEQKNNALEQKHVADALIQDMFPRHVSAQLKYTKHCSKNYDMVGVLFASIVNFSEFYEENFAGGLECIRVLHELVGDFDKELMKYEDIEKIKTVYGTTFMAASGLNVKTQVTTISQSAIRCHKYFHLKSLVDFALGLQRTLGEFNSNMLGFRFRLRCGINAGPVTAGVIGTMKPQYDVWGDTVNLASRMDSTGVEDRIQVDEDCMKKLTDFYIFQFRGTIPVKGKGERSTYLLTGRKPDNLAMGAVQE